MNPENPPNPRAELEARVTALLLGELTADEAAALRQTLAQDADLSKLHDRLRLTLELVRASAANSAADLAEQPKPLKLSAARRAALLARFKTVRPKEFARPKAGRTSLFLKLAAAVAVLLVAAALLFPANSKSKSAAAKFSVELVKADRPHAVHLGLDLAQPQAANMIEAPLDTPHPILNRILPANGQLQGGTEMRVAEMGKPREIEAAPVAPPAPPRKTDIYMGKITADNEDGAADKDLELNLRNVTVDSALRQLADAEGWTVNRKTSTHDLDTYVEVGGPMPMSKDDLLPKLNKSLANKGLTAIQDGKTLTIEKIDDAMSGAPIRVTNSWITHGIPSDVEKQKQIYDFQPQNANVDDISGPLQDLFQSSTGRASVAANNGQNPLQQRMTTGASSSTVTTVTTSSSVSAGVDEANRQRLSSESRYAESGGPRSGALASAADSSARARTAQGGGGGAAGGGGGGGGGGPGVVGGQVNLSGGVAYATQGMVGPATYTIDPISGSIVYITAPDNAQNVAPALNPDAGKPRIYYDDLATGRINITTDPNNPNIQGRLPAADHLDALAKDFADSSAPTFFNEGGIMVPPQGGRSVGRSSEKLGLVDENSKTNAASIDGVLTSGLRDQMDQSHAFDFNIPGSREASAEGASGRGGAGGRGSGRGRGGAGGGAVAGAGGNNVLSSGVNSFAAFAGPVGGAFGGGGFGGAGAGGASGPGERNRYVDGNGGASDRNWNEGTNGNFATPYVGRDSGGLENRMFHLNSNSILQLELRSLVESNIGGGIAGIGGGYGGGGGQGTASYSAVTVAPSGGAGGLPYSTKTNEVVDGSRQFYRYFDSVGINLHTNGAFAFANARTGEVVVRTTPEDLAMVEQSLDLLNKTPSELQIDAKFVSVTSNDAKGLGFQWDLGNMPLTNGSIGAQAGSAPSYTGQPGGANPSGIFPGAGPVRTPASPKPANVPIIGDVPLIGGLFRHEATKAEVAREKSGGSVGSVGSDGSVGLEAWADRPSDAKPAVSHAAAAAQLAANDAWPRSVTNGPAGALSAGKWEMPLSGVDARESAGKIYLPGDEKEQGAIYRRWTEDNGDKVPAPQVMRIGGVVSSAPVTNSVVRVEATGGFSGRVVTTASEEKFKGELAAAGDYIAHGSHDAGITILSSNMIGGHFTSIATNGVATRRFASEPVAPLRGAPPVSASKPQSAPSAVPSAVALAKADAVSKVEARTKSEIRNPQSAIRHLEEPPKPKAAAEAPIPQSEVQTRDNAFSTFSLNVSDVSFKLASASLQNGKLPDTATVRSEEFINAFNYHDTEPAPGAPVGFVAERTRWPFDHNRDLLRFSVKTSSEGRQAGRPLNLVLVLDKSGSMERADRVAIIREALRVLASQLQAQDILSVVVFARTPRLFADGRHGNEAGKLADELEAITPEGGTNLEEAMRLAYETALRHYLANGENRVVLLTDGAANLGNVEPELFKKKAEAEREQGVALDCFGVGWEDYNDNLLEVLSRSGGGRYGFINTPQEAATEFAGQLAGALRVAASDVKVQVEFNSNRVISWRQIGYAKDQLKKEQFRDNTVKAAQLTVAESGNALYTVELNPAGNGPVGTVFVRYRAPGTSDYYEHAWEVPYTGAAPALDQAAPAMRLAGAAAAFSEWLAGSPYAGEVTLDGLQGCLRGVPELYGADTRPKQLETMIREARSIAGK